ncbi:MAG: gluconokinase [Saprospiraceae bacterium]|nr:gluconokinase [Saprospiraceae bacterium]
MGVSGSGKTTIGKLLAEHSGLPFFDGDDFHPAENIEKMQSGNPLNDDDRLGWLTAINHHARQEVGQHGAIYACSALKASYRRILSEGIGHKVAWVFLKGDYDLIRSRLEARKAHFMPPALLQSQFDALEFPEEAFSADLNLTPETIVGQILEFFQFGKI